MSVRLGVGAGCAATFCTFASATGAANRTPVVIPAPTTPVAAHPPVGQPNPAAPGRRPPGRIDARTRVVVDLDARGAPTAVSAVQRLTVHGVGDYFFTIPAPLRDVLPGPGTQSEPGLRPGTVLWQGFSGGGRVLSARLLLEPARASASLPLRVRLSRAGSAVTLELVNTTAVRVSSFTAAVAPGEARRYLAGLARFTAGGPAPSPYMTGTNVRALTRTVVAPIRVTGAIAIAPGRRVRLDLILRAGRRRIRIPADPTFRPKLQLLVRPARITSQPRRPTLDDAMESTLSLARALQYEEFIANPDAGGKSATTYVFRSALPRKATPARVGGKTDSPLPEVLLWCGLAFGLVAGIVVWAHS